MSSIVYLTRSIFLSAVSLISVRWAEEAIYTILIYLWYLCGILVVRLSTFNTTLGNGNISIERSKSLQSLKQTGICLKKKKNSSTVNAFTYRSSSCDVKVSFWDIIILILHGGGRNYNLGVHRWISLTTDNDMNLDFQLSSNATFNLMQDMRKYPFRYGNKYIILPWVRVVLAGIFSSTVWYRVIANPL